MKELLPREVSKVKLKLIILCVFAAIAATYAAGFSDGPLGANTADGWTWDDR